MSYRIQENEKILEGRHPQSAHFCYLIIDPKVALLDGVLFTDTNAAASEHKEEQGLEGLNLIDFKTIKHHLKGERVDDKDKWEKNIQAECLVPDVVPLEYIKGISFISEASLKEGKRLWGGDKHPPFTVDENLFYNFSHVKCAILTSGEVNEANVGSKKFKDKRKFKLGRDAKITLLVNLKVSHQKPEESKKLQIQTKTIWKNSSAKEIPPPIIKEFREGEYWDMSTIEINGLSEGDYSVEYYIKKTRWVKIDFTIRGKYGKAR